MAQVENITHGQHSDPSSRTRTLRQIRLWPACIIVALEAAALTVPGWLAPGTMLQGQMMFFGPQVGTLLFLIWWLSASRATWSDKLIGLATAVLAGVGANALSHTTIRPLGLMLYGLPALAGCWTLWLFFARTAGSPAVQFGLPVVICAVAGFFTALRIEGVSGAMSVAFNWRWSPTSEEKFLQAQKAAQPNARAGTSASEWIAAAGDWPAFRGDRRDGKWSAGKIGVDWKAHPPKLLWKHRVGPGWSSFAVVGEWAFTQEQRGSNECVVCYRTSDGAEVWAHNAAGRFEEVVAGAGPRATPTFDKGRIYAVAATGKLECLDARTGKMLWTQDFKEQSAAKTPMWGFSSSPLVAEGVVSVFAGGAAGKSLLAYSTNDGAPRWTAGNDNSSYSSPQLVRLAGVEQILFAGCAGLIALDPAKGSVLWNYDWKTEGNAIRIVQPALLGDDELLLGTPQDQGTRRLQVRRENGEWKITEKWTSNNFRPYFNDFVVHKGFGYGFDGPIFECFDAETGKRLWRERRYGAGQVLLLPLQDLLLVLSEQGEVALVETNRQALIERARFQAIEGKTWNHPVIAHGRLLVRNAEEAACFQLAESSDSPSEK